MILDSRAVHASPSRTAAALDAKAKKPKVPVHAVRTADAPMIRFIGSDDVNDSSALFSDWSARLEEWQTAHSPLLFIHTPEMGDVFPLLHRLWPQIQPYSDGLPSLPEWPDQASLF